MWCHTYHTLLWLTWRINNLPPPATEDTTCNAFLVHRYRLKIKPIKNALHSQRAKAS
ncbi:hypothetical protein PORCAN_226 [Porphyromonas crevioricanis JCM 13913]|nr:hypothetical protein PORCAN_226 [Porphyromonas crevioricanis JCM 13913]